MPGLHSRRKGRSYELEVRAELMTYAPAERTSEAGISVPDLRWLERYVECRIRSDQYESMAKIQSELDGDASLYVTRLDRGHSLAVLRLDTLLDLLAEARGSSPQGPMVYG